MNQRIETIEVELTAKERQAAGESLARVLAEIQRLDDRKAAVVAALKEQRAELEADVAVYRDQVNHRRKVVDIDVQDQRNDSTGTMDTVRMDTGEVLRSRPYTAEERQPNLVGLTDHEAEEWAEIAKGFEQSREAGRGRSVDADNRQHS